MPIPQQVPIISHTGNGVTRSFAYAFAVLDADDLKVRVGGADITTGFVVNGVGGRQGGTVVFDVAPGSGVAVLLRREISLERATDYQYLGDLREDVLDGDFDRIWMALQDQLVIASRTLRAPVGETFAELPAASGRALRVLGFDAQGAPILLSRTDDGGSALALDLLSSGGSSLVGFIQSGAGAVTRTSQDKSRETVSVLDFGAVPGGIVDCTQAFNLAVQSGAGVVVVPPGTYLINPRHMLYSDGSYSQATRVGVSIPSNVTLMMYGATLVSVDTDREAYSLLASYRASNVHIKGGKLIGDRATNSSNPAVPDDYGFGVDFRDVTDCSVEDVESNDMWGDSFYLGVTDTAGTGSTRVIYRNIKGSGSRRQGLSITGGKQIVVDGWNFRNIRGAALGPCAGIDIEPNTTDLVDDVIITNGYVENCNRPVQVFKTINLVISNLQVENCDVLFPMLSDRVFDVTMDNIIARGGANTKYGVLWQNSLDIGNVQVSNFSISGASLYAVFMNDTVGKPFTDVVFRDGVIFVKDAPVNTSFASSQGFGGITFDSVRWIIPSGFDASDAVNLSPSGYVFDGQNTLFTDCSIVNRGTASLSFDCGQYGNRGNTFENINPIRDLISLQNGWAAAASHETPFFVRSRDGVVTVHGAISGGTGSAGTLLFTLPAGFRPSAQVFAPIVARDAGAVVSGKGVTVDSNGQVTLADNTGTNRVGLGSISFLARN